MLEHIYPAESRNRPLLLPIYDTTHSFFSSFHATCHFFLSPKLPLSLFSCLYKTYLFIVDKTDIHFVARKLDVDLDEKKREERKMV